MALNEKTQKALSIVLRVFTVILVAITLFMMVFTIISVSLFDKNDRAIFGYKLFIVQSDSMSLSENNKDLDVHFNAGDIVIVKKNIKASDLAPGDIISFVSQNEDSYGETVTHMIKEVRRTSEGKLLGYQTYGTNTGTEDEVLVEPEFILGKYVNHVAKVGLFFAFMKSVPGYIVCILVPFLLLIGYQAANVIRLYKRYKAEQNAEIDAERQKMEQERRDLEAQRLESARMLEELAALKAQLENAGAVPVTKSAPEAPAAAEENAAEENSGEG